MNNTNSINCFADLEREEARLKKRLKTQEAEIKLKLKTLPEELVTAGITKLITSIINGDLFKSTSSIIKTISSLFRKPKEESTAHADSKSSMTDILKLVLKGLIN